MTLAQAFAAQLETKNFGTVSQSIHLSKFPDTVTDPTDNWLVAANGGEAAQGGTTRRWQVIHTLTLSHWQDTDINLHAADEALRSAFASSLTLSGYTVVAYDVMPMEDLPDEDHTNTYHAVWQIHITILKES